MCEPTPLSPPQESFTRSLHPLQTIPVSQSLSLSLIFRNSSVPTFSLWCLGIYMNFILMTSLADYVALHIDSATSLPILFDHTCLFITIASRYREPPDVKCIHHLDDPNIFDTFVRLQRSRSGHRHTINRTILVHRRSKDEWWRGC